MRWILASGLLLLAACSDRSPQRNERSSPDGRAGERAAVIRADADVRTAERAPVGR